MSRALWIASAAIFTSLLLYLAFVGHRERVLRVVSAMPNVVQVVTGLVDRISLPRTIKVTGEKTIAKTGKSSPLPGVALSDVEYSADGQLVLTGRASPGAQLNFLINGARVKAQSFTAQGVWKLKVPEGVPPGQHRLEVVVAARKGARDFMIVLPFAKAGRQEIAAVTRTVKNIPDEGSRHELKPEAGKITSGRSTKTQKEKPAKTLPGQSKLAKLARSQSVKSDAELLVGLLPGLRIDDGPSLVTPQLSVPRPVIVKPGASPVPGKRENVKPVLIPRKSWPELVAPKVLRIVKVKPMKAKKPLLREQNGQKVAKPAKIAVSTAPKKVPYTGYRNVTVVPGKGLVVVQPGNTLWDLAISIYGSSRYYKKLYRANRYTIRNPQLIYPGQIIFAPDANPPASIEPLSPPQWVPLQ